LNTYIYALCDPDTLLKKTFEDPLIRIKKSENAIKLWADPKFREK